MRHLADNEINYIDDLLNGRVSNRPGVGELTAEGLIELRSAFAFERKQRLARIPQDWREQAAEFVAEKGAYQLVPGIAGGRLYRERKSNVQLVIDNVDTLLMLVGDPEIPEA